MVGESDVPVGAVRTRHLHVGAPQRIEGARAAQFEQGDTEGLDFHDTLSHVHTQRVPAVAVHDLARELREHQAIYNAIARRDGESARAAMRQHLRGLM